MFRYYDPLDIAWNEKRALEQIRIPYTSINDLMSGEWQYTPVFNLSAYRQCRFCDAMHVYSDYRRFLLPTKFHFKFFGDLSPQRAGIGIVIDEWEPFVTCPTHLPLFKKELGSRWREILQRQRVFQQELPKIREYERELNKLASFLHARRTALRARLDWQGMASPQAAT